MTVEQDNKVRNIHWYTSVRETSVRESDCPGNVCKASIPYVLWYALRDETDIVVWKYFIHQTEIW